MSDDAFTWMHKSPAKGAPTTSPRVRRRHAGDGDTIDELRARLSELQARLDALEGSVEAWQAVAGWLPASGVRLLAAYRQRSPQGTRRERFIRVMDIAGNHLADTSATAPRWIGRGLRALASTLRTRAAA